MNQSSVRHIRIVLLVLATVVSAIPAAAAPEPIEMAFYPVPAPKGPICRAYDSRPGHPAELHSPAGPLDRGVVYDVKLDDLCSLPANADGVVINVAAIGAVGPGDLSVFPTDPSPPAPLDPPINAVFFPAPGPEGPPDRSITLTVLFGTNGSVSFRASPGPGKYHVKIDITQYVTKTIINNDEFTVDEDAGATEFDVLFNDTDPTPRTLLIDSVTQPANGTVVPTPVGPGPYTELTYQPNADYCNNPPGTTKDTFEYTLTFGQSGTVEVTVNCENDAPSFTKGPDVSVAQDSGPQTIDPWATAISPGPANEAGQSVTFEVTGNTNSGLFSAGPAVSPTGVLTFTPTAGATGTATITIRAKDDGGTAGGGIDTSATQTFDITISDVNEPPSFTVGPNQTVNEDAGPQTVNPWATDISPGPPSESGQTVTFNITNNTNPGLFSAGPAVSSSGVLTYTPAPDANGTATITLVAMDNGGGTDTSAPQMFTITVTAVNDPPSFTVGPNQTVNEDAGPQTVNPWATAISPGPPDESGQTVTFNITGNTNAALFSAGPAVSPTGVLTYTPAANTSGSATITLVLMDNGGGATDTSAPQMFTITVNGINDPPSFTAGPNQTVNEDAGPQTVNPWATAISPGPPDESGQTVTFNITGNTNAALFSAGPAVSPTGVLTYTPAANTSGSATITLVLMDNGGGTDTSAPQMFTITVTAINDPPSFTVGPNQTVNEDAGPQTVNPWATAISPGPPDESGQTVTFNITGNTNAALFSAGPAVSPTGVLTYTPAADAFGSATITLVLMDNGGGTDTSAPQMFTITVNGINDPPSFTAGPDQTVNEDAGPQTVNPWATAISPGPNELGQTLTFNITGNTNTALFSAGPAVSPTGVLTYTSAANAFGTATITLVLMDNGGGTDTSAPQMFTITVNAVNDPPLAVDDIFDTIGNTELRVDLAAPGVTPHALETTGGAPFGVLDGSPLPDRDPVENDAITLTGIFGCGDVSAPFGDSPVCNTVNGGTVILEGDGSFSYVPPPGHAAASDSFQYTIQDNGVPSPASDTGLVTINRLERIWYVDPNAGGGGNGTSVLPFNTLDALDGAGGAGDSDVISDYIFVHDGSLALSAAMEMEANQRLIGQGNVNTGPAAGFALSIPVNLNFNGMPTNLVATGTHPELTNASGNTVTVGNAIPIEIVGLSLAGGTIAGGGACGSPTFACNAIDLTSAAGALTGSGTLTIADNVIRGAGAEGIDVNLNAGTTGTLALNVALNSWDLLGTHTGNAVDINRVAGTLNLDFSGNTNIKSNNAAGAAVLINGGAAASTSITGFSSNSISGDTLGAGVMVSNATFDSNTTTGGIQQVDGDNLVIGASVNPVGGLGMSLGTVLGNLFFDDLDIFAGASGLSINGAMTFAVTPATPDGSGTSTIDADNGAAVDITAATIDLRLADMDSTTTGSGVSLSTVGANSQFRAPSGSSIVKSSGGGTAFSVASSGTGTTVSYGGTLNVTSGAGVSLTNNGGSTIGFTGLLTLNTGGNPAFAATGGGTVTATDTASTLTTSTNTALNVANTTIGASGLRFRSISAGTPGTGPTNGIVLNNTGSSGGLTVSGTGTADSGGTIQSCSGDSVSLSSAQDVSLTEMQISSSGDNAVQATTVTRLTLDSVDIATTGNTGILGTTVTDFKFQNGSTMTGAGNAANEYGIFITDLFGANSAVTNSSVTGSAVINLFVTNNNSTPGTLTISNSTLNNTAAATGGDGVSLVGNNSANLTANLTGGNNLNNNQGDGIQISANNSSVVNVTVNGSTSNYNANLGSAVNIAAADSATITALVSGFNGVSTGTSSANGLNAINIQNFNTSTINATVQNNVISGLGNNASAIRVIQEANGTINANINNNTITGFVANGIVAQARAGTGTLNLTIGAGNNINLASGLALDGVSIESGSSAGGDSNTICLNMFNNTSAASAQQGYRLRQRTGTTFRLQNFGTSPCGSNGASATDISCWVNTTKSNTGTTDIVIGTAFSVAPANCPTPSLPL